MRKQGFCLGAIAGCVLFAGVCIALGQVAQQPANMKIRMVVVETAEKGREVLRRLEAGESFTRLAKELSIGPNAEAGGYIGTVATAELDDELRDALIGLRVGDHTDVIQTALGYSIVQLTTDEYYEAGVQHYEMGQYQPAVDALKRDIALNPDSALSYIYLGLCYAALDKLDVAIKAYKKSIDLNPSIAEAYYDLGNAHRRTGETEKAKAMYEKAIEIKPDFAAAHNNLAWLYAQEGKYLTAGIEHAQRATDLSSNNPIYLETLARLYYLQGEYERAIDQIERAIRLDFKNQHYKDELARYQRAAAGEEPEKPVVSKEEPAPSPKPEVTAQQEEAVAVKGTPEQPGQVTKVPTESRPEKLPLAQIEVLNGSPSPDAAESVAAWLRGQDYPVSHVGMADRSDWPRTTLLYRKEYLDLALEIAHKMQGNQDVEQLRTPSEYDIVIVVGKD